MDWLLLSCGFGFFVPMLVFLLRGDLKNGYLMSAIANGFLLLSSLVSHLTVSASINSACMAMAIWNWWNNGGGDDTKKKWRKLKKKFEGVRRTAPATA